MSFKPITERKTKNKTEDINEYMRLYRIERKDHLKNVDKCKYYLKKGLSQDLIDKYGELSGDIFKLKSLFRNILEKNPDLKNDLIAELE